MTDLVSVAIPAYNAEETIGACLDALARQTYSAGPVEVIVVDDGSTDRTKEIVEEHDVRYVHQSQSGPAVARNRGIEEAHGSILLFTDSDCIPEPNWVEEMLDPFEDPEVIAVKGAYRSPQKSLVARFAQIEFEERYEMLKRASSIDMIDTYSAGYRLATLRETGGFDTSYPEANNEDTELSYRLAEQGHKMVFNADAIVNHLGHPDSISKYMRLKFWRGYWRVKVYRQHPSKAVSDSYTPQSLKLQIAFFYLALATLFASAVVSPAAVVFFVSTLAFATTAVPFAVFAIRRDATIGLLSPFFLAMRAASIGAGVLWAMVGFFFRPSADQRLESSDVLRMDLNDEKSM